MLVLEHSDLVDDRVWRHLTARAYRGLGTKMQSRIERRARVAGRLARLLTLLLSVVGHGACFASQCMAVESLPHATEARSVTINAKKDDAAWRSTRTCGINCLYFLLRSEDKPAEYAVLYEQLLEECPISLYRIKTVAARYGLEFQLATIGPDELRRVHKPAIAHLEIVNHRAEAGGHFVVVIAADSDGVRYVDGTTAETRSVSWRDFQRKWSGIVAYKRSAGIDSVAWGMAGFCAVASFAAASAMNRRVRCHSKFRGAT